MNPFEEAVKSLNLGYRPAPRPADFSAFTGALDRPLDFKTLARDIPCQAACPAKTNVPAYIEAIAQGDPDAAYRINQEDNVFPGVLGRVCTRPCEAACRHQWTGVFGPVPICHLKRSAADEHTVAPPLPPWFSDKTGKKVAVIGGGPAGLTAARELVRYGHQVAIFEQNEFLGGMMTAGIPKFRLPRDVIENEIQAIVDSGVEVHLNHPVDADGMAALIDAYDAVLVSVGAWRPSDLSLPGLEPGMEYAGIDFMWKYNFSEIGDIKGQSVVIVGGGFTAVDCARSCARAARQLVGEEGRVTVLYRRTEAQMSANSDELEEMRMENIDIETLVSPVRAVTEDGKLTGVVFRRNMLGDPAPGHTKPPISSVEDSEFEVPCNLLIVAIGQTRQIEVMADGVRFDHDQRNHETSLPRVFVAGDFSYGGEDVINAVEDGKQAAAAIDRYLTGEVRLTTHVAVEEIHPPEGRGETGRVRDHDIQAPGPMPVLPLAGRDGQAEVELGFDPAARDIGATRCYLCHYKFEIDQDKCIHCDWCIKVAPRDCIKRVSRLFHDEDGAVKFEVESDLAADTTYIWIDSDECIRCGNCLRACPTEAISLRKMARTTCASGGGCGS